MLQNLAFFLTGYMQCEMIISNIGTIVLSLCPEAISGVRSLSHSAETVTATQVRLISLSNTLSRLLSGPLADFVSPLTSHDGLTHPQRYRISRVVLLSGISLLLAGTFVYLELAIRTPDGLRILRYVILWPPCVTLCSTIYPVLAPVLLMVPHSQSCASYLPSLPCIAHSSCPGPDPALYPPSGEAGTAVVILA